jgi:hypothetical protein
MGVNCACPRPCRDRPWRTIRTGGERYPDERAVPHTRLMTSTRHGAPRAERGSSRRIPLGVTVGLLAAVAIAVVFAAFAAGQRNPRVVEEDVRCASAGTISCELSDGSDVNVPLDVFWVDVSGRSHEGDRPECLPPRGSGSAGPVRVAWTPVEVDGLGWRQVLRVTCLS